MANAEPFEMQELNKANAVINAIFNSSLIENQVIAISLNKIRKDEDGRLYSELKAAELKKMMNKKSGSFYDQLKECANGMSNKKIVMENREKNQFIVMNIVQTALYNKGKFYIRYNDDLEYCLYNIKINFTRLNLKFLSTCKTVYTFRLYELLKSKAYYPKGYEREDNIFKITYNLAELKLDIGAVNSSQDKVQKILKTEKPDFEKAVAVANEQSFVRWCDFKPVIENSVNEINASKLTDMHIELLKPNTAGRGGKVYELVFIVETNINKKKINKTLTEEDKQKVLEETDELLAEQDIRLRELKIICETAEYDMGKIRTAYKVFKEQEDKVENFVKWFITAIKKSFQENNKNNDDIEEKKIVKPASKKSSYKDFKQREDYDFEQIELDVLKRGSSQEEILQECKVVGGESY